MVFVIYEFVGLEGNRELSCETVTFACLGGLGHLKD